MTSFALVGLYSSIILYMSYVSMIYIKYRPSSLSNSYYKIKWPSLFTVWLIVVSCLIFPSWVEISPVNFQFLPFLSVISLSTVALSPRYLESDRKAHYIAAAIAAILSVIWCIVLGAYVNLIIFAIALAIICLLKIKNKLFWAENLAFSNIYSTIFLS